MMKLGSKKKVALTYNDYKIQLFQYHEQDLTKAILIEQDLPKDLIRDGAIVDEVGVFELIKQIVKESKLKGQSVIFTVPDNALTMRKVDYPLDLSGAAIKEYFELEIGQSVHLPFEEPVIDVVDLPEEGQALLFATNGIEIRKIQGILYDAGLKPIAADARALATLRMVEQIFPEFVDRITMTVAVSINELSLSIYDKGVLEFIRYHTIETELVQWEPTEEGDHLTFTYKGNTSEYQMDLMEALAEMNRIMNFYRFSINKDQQNVEQVILLGDCPEITYIKNMLESQMDVPIYTLEDSRVKEQFPALHASNAEVVGLALKDELLSAIPNINLLPSFKAEGSKKVWIWGAAVVVTILIASIAIWNASISKEIKALEQEKAANQAIVDDEKAKVAAYEQEKQNSLDAAVKVIERLAYPVTPVMDAIRKDLQPYEYELNFTFSANQATVDIQYETFTQVANYVDQLQTNPLFTDIKVTTIEVNPVELPNAATSVPRHKAQLTLDLNLAKLIEGEKES